VGIDAGIATISGVATVVVVSHAANVDPSSSPHHRRRFFSPGINPHLLVGEGGTGEVAACAPLPVVSSLLLQFLLPSSAETSAVVVAVIATAPAIAIMTTTDAVIAAASR
jgi:hypothetical protein